MQNTIPSQVAHATRLAAKLNKPAKINAAGEVWLLKSNPRSTWYESLSTRAQVTLRGRLTLVAPRHSNAREACRQIASALGITKLRVANE
jgi:dTDP-4-dehydrorhamnose reductase